MKISLITTCHNREAHLANLILGLAQGTRLPDELILVSSQPLDSEVYTGCLPIFNSVIPDVGSRWDIGTARNLGAQKARYPVLIFLDVDCVPAPDFVEKIATSAEQNEGLIMGSPRYLSHPLAAGWQTPDLIRDSGFHPHFLYPDSAIRQENNYGFFWSLCFAIRRAGFGKLGGFDESFRGYGAEDTDFAFRAREFAMPFFVTDAQVFHQQHPVYSPPVNHFADIVRNATRFYEKWHIWPMDGWLTRFAEMGLIDWAGPGATTLEVLTQPDATTLAECYRPKAAYV